MSPTTRRSLPTPTALILNEGLVREVVLEPGASVAIEADQSNVLTEASGLAFDADTTRRFELDLEGDNARDIALSYLTEAPAWKNSWRLLLGEGRLQGWATVENVSGQPWNGVALTLSTGAPVAYARDLLSPRRFARLDPPDLLGERPKVRADEGFAESADSADSAFAAAPQLTESRARMGALMEAPVAAPSAPSAPAEAVRGIANVRYTVPYPVELGAGRTANLLYIDLAVDAKVHALYQPGSSDDILLAARLTADQPLAPGLVSVRDETGFVGDAPFTGLDAGQVRLLPYAAAPQATVRQSRSERGASIDLVAAGGALRLELREEVRSRYAARGAGRRRRLRGRASAQQCPPRAHQWRGGGECGLPAHLRARDRRRGRGDAPGAAGERAALRARTDQGCARSSTRLLSAAPRCPTRTAPSSRPPPQSSARSTRRRRGSTISRPATRR